MIYTKPKKKTEAEKKQEKIEKRKQLEKKWKVAKPKRTKKTHPKSWYKKHLDTIFSIYIRLRDKRCQKCGSELQLQNSHVIPRTNLALRWDEKNCKALCVSCHLYWWHRDVLAAQKWFKQKFPERAKYLEKHRNDIADYTLEDYIKMYEELKIKVKQLENGK